MNDFLSELRWRGLLNQSTDENFLAAHLASGQRRAYVGFDPTADSLTVGNFVAIKLLMHFQRAGHVPYVVAGGGTGLIGDPSGKSAERMLLTRDQVEANVRGQLRIFERLLDFSPRSPGRARVVNNLDWLEKLDFIEALRDVGKHFSVNAMIQRDSVRERLQHRDQGISYTEFSYVLLQAYDFLHLRRAEDVTVQMGGSDQWGNMVSGVDLIRRVLPPASHDAHAVTAPLVAKADGGKFGKTESGAIWLTADRTSPYAFYQFWLNTDDREVVRFLKVFTLLGAEEVEALAAAHEANPGARAPQRALARHMTELVHGAAERDAAEKAAEALFSGELASLPARLLDDLFAAVPASEHDAALLDVAGGLNAVDALLRTSLVNSKREARELLASGSITINGRRFGTDDTLTPADLLHGTTVAFRRGKKAWHVTRWKR